MSRKPRDTQRYHIIQDGKIVHRGITNDPDRREGEHQQSFGDGAWLKKIGPKVTRDSGLDWEQEGGKRI